MDAYGRAHVDERKLICKFFGRMHALAHNTYEIQMEITNALGSE
jgi:hypothetical protein